MYSSQSADLHLAKSLWLCIPHCHISASFTALSEYIKRPSELHKAVILISFVLRWDKCDRIFARFIWAQMGLRLGG